MTDKTLSEELQYVSGMALAHGYTKAVEAIQKLILDAEIAANPVPTTTDEDAEALFAEIEALVAESIGSVVKLDSTMSNRLADTVMGIEDENKAIEFVRRVMIDLRVLPQQTGKIVRMDSVLSAHLLETIA